MPAQMGANAQLAPINDNLPTLPSAKMLIKKALDNSGHKAEKK